MTIKNLLLIEYIKSKKRNTRFFIISLLIVLLILITSSLIVKINISTSPEKNDSLNEIHINPLIAFKIYFENLSLVSIIVLCIYFISSISSDVQNGVFRKHFIDGLQEEDILQSKVMIAFIFSLFIAIISYLLFILAGFFLAGISIYVFLHKEIVVLFSKIFFKTFYYASLSMATVFFLKSTGKSITCLFLIFILEKVVIFYLNNQNVFAINNFLPFNCLNEYFNTPIIKNLIAVLAFFNLFFIGIYFACNRKRLAA